MRITIYTDRETQKVRRVETRFPNSITEEEIQKRVEEYNNTESNYCSIEIIEVDDKVCEVIKFLLGEDDYRTTYELTDLKKWLEELNEQIEDLYNSRCDIEYDIRRMIESIKEKDL